MFALLENCLNIFHIVGARPNFMKVTPVLNALKGRKNMEVPRQRDAFDDDSE
jgi:hypothetical protein